MTADSGMTETEAKAWLSARGWMSGDAGSRLEWLAQEVLAEADRQNLISAGTRPFLWARHIVDSAQLLDCLPDNATDGLWLDIGTGAGFPGLVVASLSNRPMLLVEPRPLRVAHLERCIAAMGLTHCRVARASVAAIEGEERPAIISARAYAPLERIFASAGHLANLSTCWMLPKGRSAEKELVTARQEWQGVFHVKQSATDPESRIIVASGVERRRIAPRQAPSGQFSRRGRRAQP